MLITHTYASKERSAITPSETKKIGQYSKRKDIKDRDHASSHYLMICEGKPPIENINNTVQPSVRYSGVNVPVLKGTECYEAELGGGGSGAALMKISKNGKYVVRKYMPFYKVVGKGYDVSHSAEAQIAEAQSLIDLFEWRNKLLVKDLDGMGDYVNYNLEKFHKYRDKYLINILESCVYVNACLTGIDKPKLPFQIKDKFNVSHFNDLQIDDNTISRIQHVSNDSPETLHLLGAFYDMEYASNTIDATRMVIDESLLADNHLLLFTENFLNAFTEGLNESQEIYSDNENLDKDLGALVVDLLWFKKLNARFSILDSQYAFLSFSQAHQTDNIQKLSDIKTFNKIRVKHFQDKYSHTIYNPKKIVDDFKFYFFDSIIPTRRQSFLFHGDAQIGNILVPLNGNSSLHNTLTIKIVDRKPVKVTDSVVDIAYLFHGNLIQPILGDWSLLSKNEGSNVFNLNRFESLSDVSRYHRLLFFDRVLWNVFLKTDYAIKGLEKDPFYLVRVKYFSLVQLLCSVGVNLERFVTMKIEGKLKKAVFFEKHIFEGLIVAGIKVKEFCESLASGSLFVKEGKEKLKKDLIEWAYRWLDDFDRYSI